MRMVRGRTDQSFEILQAATVCPRVISQPRIREAVISDLCDHAKGVRIR
jgi:hypothetical protein